MLFADRVTRWLRDHDLVDPKIYTEKDWPNVFAIIAEWLNTDGERTGRKYCFVLVDTDLYKRREHTPRVPRLHISYGIAEYSLTRLDNNRPIYHRRVVSCLDTKFGPGMNPDKPGTFDFRLKGELADKDIRERHEVDRYPGVISIVYSPSCGSHKKTRYMRTIFDHEQWGRRRPKPGEEIKQADYDKPLRLGTFKYLRADTQPRNAEAAFSEAVNDLLVPVQ